MAASLKCCHLAFALLTPDPDGENTSKDPLSGFDGGGWGWGLFGIKRKETCHRRETWSGMSNVSKEYH